MHVCVSVSVCMEGWSGVGWNGKEASQPSTNMAGHRGWIVTGMACGKPDAHSATYGQSQSQGPLDATNLGPSPHTHQCTVNGGKELVVMIHLNKKQNP